MWFVCCLRFVCIFGFSLLSLLRMVCVVMYSLCLSCRVCVLNVTYGTGAVSQDKFQCKLIKYIVSYRMEEASDAIRF